MDTIEARPPVPHTSSLPPTSFTVASNDPSSFRQTNAAEPNTYSKPLPITFASYNESTSRPRTPQLPPLSTSTEQILARVRAQNFGMMDPKLAPHRGWFPYSKPKFLVMPTSTRDVKSGPNYATSSSQPPTFSKADLKSTLATNLAPKSRMLPSQRLEPTEALGHDSDTDSDAEFEHSNPGRHPSSLPPLEDTINARQQTVATPANATTMKLISPQMTFTPAPIRPPTALGRPPSSARKVRSYVLPDGTVTASGKGLGRGRPGIKRGPRKSKLSTEVTVDFQLDALPPPSTPATTIPVINNKRKRTDSVASEVVTTLVSRSNSSTPEYTGQSTQTRSGRQTQKPATLIPPSSPTLNPVTTTASPYTPVNQTPKRGRPEASMQNSNSLNPRATLTHPKIKRRIYRGAAREQMALCEHCLRGNGPTGNAIVFCDACNRCWHQRCHDPAIPKQVVNDAKAEWVCIECDAILKGGKKGKQAKKSSKPNIAPNTPIDTSDRGAFNTPSIPIGLVPASALTRDQRVAFLSKLSKDRLIDLVLRASDLAPLLALFEAPNPPPAPVQSHNSTQPHTDEDEGFQSGEDGLEYYADEHVHLYPKAGHGVTLPPDSADLAMLLEGPECRTFSHWVAPVGSVGGLEGLKSTLVSF